MVAHAIRQNMVRKLFTCLMAPVLLTYHIILSFPSISISPSLTPSLFLSRSSLSSSLPWTQDIRVRSCRAYSLHLHHVENREDLENLSNSSTRISLLSKACLHSHLMHIQFRLSVLTARWMGGELRIKTCIELITCVCIKYDFT